MSCSCLVVLPCLASSRSSFLDGVLQPAAARAKRLPLQPVLSISYSLDSRFAIRNSALAVIAGPACRPASRADTSTTAESLCALSRGPSPLDSYISTAGARCTTRRGLDDSLPPNRMYVPLSSPHVRVGCPSRPRESRSAPAPVHSKLRVSPTAADGSLPLPLQRPRA